jgi:hypothetical protein
MSAYARAQSLLFTLSLALCAGDTRLSNDFGGGYISAYTLATGIPYTDAVLGECSIARGRQNEPSVAANPRNPKVLVGSSNDYCGTYAGSTTSFVAAGPIWLGYYRSENGGVSFRSSLVPGYPGDQSPFAALAHIRTASAGDPVVAWDGHGRVFLGSESSDDPAGSKKTFGDSWVARFENPRGESGNTLDDGKMYVGTSVVASGSSAPNLLGKFHDKTAIEADHTGGTCDANVYFAWSRFTGIGNSNIYFSRSTDHGVTWSTPQLLTQNIKNVQDPDISVTGNGHVYVTFDMGATNSGQVNSVGIAKSTDCGRTFGKPGVAVAYTIYEAQDISAQQPAPARLPDDPPSGEEAAGSAMRDCGDFLNACQSGYTFFRHGTSTRSTADQRDAGREWIYIVYAASKPGTETATGNTFGSVTSGTGSQSGAYFVRYDGAAGTSTSPMLIDDRAIGHQIFPDISADSGMLYTIWWDSRGDPSYSPARPVGNDAAGVTGPALDVYAAASSDGGATWSIPNKLNSVRSNPNFEQFSDRSVPFAGDYLWVTSVGSFAYGAWTDWRNTVPGTDPREPAAADRADVKQCRTLDSATGLWSSDQCPHNGGIDQDIYGASIPKPPI